METATERTEVTTEMQPDVSLGRRIFNRRTAISIAISLTLLFFLLTRVQIDFQRTFQVISRANPWLYLVALGVYYLVFPVRAVRWGQMLANAGSSRASIPPVSTLSGIILVSWFVNCLVPAKLGDVYRAYLLKRDSVPKGRGVGGVPQKSPLRGPGVHSAASPTPDETSNSAISLTKAGGTVVAERIIDFAFVLILLGLTGLISFRGRLPEYLVSGLEVATVLAIAAGSALLVMWRRPDLIRRVLPERLHPLYARFEEGTLGAFGSYPLLLSFTVLAWLIEALRLFFVIRSIGLVLDQHLLVELALVGFIALVSSLFTAPPGLPAGLGYVEASIVTALVLLDQPTDIALSVALLDRSISYASLVVFGAIFYLLTRQRG